VLASVAGFDLDCPPANGRYERIMGLASACLSRWLLLWMIAELGLIKFSRLLAGLPLTAAAPAGLLMLPGCWEGPSSGHASPLALALCLFWYATPGLASPGCCSLGPRLEGLAPS